MISISYPTLFGRIKAFSGADGRPALELADIALSSDYLSRNPVKIKRSTGKTEIVKLDGYSHRWDILQGVLAWGLLYQRDVSGFGNTPDAQRPVPRAMRALGLDKLGNRLVHNKGTIVKLAFKAPNPWIVKVVSARPMPERVQHMRDRADRKRKVHKDSGLAKLEAYQSHIDRVAFIRKSKSES